ncbi:hypothetical protein [Alteromonas sp. a30]|uniref:hypothetical protein n=1 Tax=Alteromonas sp. a30 TaxID=2730917 RepID=UPI00228121E3|nr:hypothetical protein [Alteromonas sp. a30]MCY7296447.1 hypothetical protein [Alteromonas sp. a30]
MNIAIINSAGFWPMGWATDETSQQDTIQTLTRLGVNVTVTEVANVDELVSFLTTLKQEESSDSYLIWPNAYEVFLDQHSNQKAWLADIIEEHGFALIGNNAEALRNVMSKSQCQRILSNHRVPIPAFLSVDQSLLDDAVLLQQSLETHQLSYPLFIKPHNLSTSKGITQDNVVYCFDTLYEQVNLIGKNFGFPVMIEEYLPGQDITVSVFMTGDSPSTLPTYYDTKIYDDPGAVLDHSIRMRDWDDGKWLRVVEEPEVLEAINEVVVPAAIAVGIEGFTRIDCRFDRQGKLKVFDVNGLPGLELPFSTTVWQMIVKLDKHDQQFAFETLISLVVYCAALRYNLNMSSAIKTRAEAFIFNKALNFEVHETA